jgi:hypothetical protein
VQQNDYINWGLMTAQAQTGVTPPPPAQVFSEPPRAQLLPPAQLPPFPGAQLPPAQLPLLPQDTTSSYEEVSTAEYNVPAADAEVSPTNDDVTAAYDDAGDDVAAWQDPLLGTLAPVETDSEKGMIWIFYAACWVLIVVFWLYYWLKR